MSEYVGLPANIAQWGNIELNIIGRGILEMGDGVKLSRTELNILQTMVVVIVCFMICWAAPAFSNLLQVLQVSVRYIYTGVVAIINELGVHYLNDLVHKITPVSFSDSLSLCRDSTPSCCMSHLEVKSTRTFSRPAFLTCLAFDPRDLY